WTVIGLTGKHGVHAVLFVTEVNKPDIERVQILLQLIMVNIAEEVKRKSEAVDRIAN
ncbi:hypothetical protein ACJMK2_002761, partial [Sinanodonta woodiana]